LKLSRCSFRLTGFLLTKSVPNYDFVSLVLEESFQVPQKSSRLSFFSLISSPPLARRSFDFFEHRGISDQGYSRASSRFAPLVARSGPRCSCCCSSASRTLAPPSKVPLRDLLLSSFRSVRISLPPPSCHSLDPLSRRLQLRLCSRSDPTISVKWRLRLLFASFC